MPQLPAWTAIREALQGSRDRFEAAARDPRRAQLQQLECINKRNRETVFRRRYPQDVPIQRYEDLAPYIERMADGEANVLTADTPIAFERTGGSSGGAKLIPSTAKGMRAMQRAIFAWLDDLLTVRPAIMQGRAYWSISPAARAPEFTASGVPIGFPSDASYFGPALESQIASLLAVPPSVGTVRSIEEWRELTLASLLEAEDLTLISVWSPTFLLELLRDTSTKWPALDTISCWTDASSAPFARALAAKFPGVYMQGKGLLATEGVITIPLADCAYPVLAIESGFYEFLDGAGRPHLCDELHDGAEYTLLLTTHAGLYRYAIGDRIRVRGHFHLTPMLEFLGREGLTSDLCGEKLTDPFVTEALTGMDGFSMLAAESSGHPHYVLYLDAEASSPEAIAASVDAKLAANPQYRYARDLHQLGPVEPVLVEQPLQRYYASLADRRLGDIKVPSLAPPGDWNKIFR